MRFLVKMFFLGFIGLAFLPAFAPEQYRETAEASGEPAAPSAFAIATLVGQAAEDVRGICDRRPGVCETGEELVTYAATRAREGLVVGYAMFRHGHPSMQKQPDETAETAAEAR